MVAIMFIAAYALLATERGSQWLLTTAIQQSGQKIELSDISGTLLSQITIKQVVYNHCALDISIKDLHLAWQPRQLLATTLAIQKLTADTVVIKPRTDCNTASPEKEFTLPASMTLPIDLSLDQFAINQVIFNQPDQAPLLFDKLSLNARTQNQQVVLQIENFNYTTLNINTSMTAELQQPYNLQADANWRYVQGKDTFQGAMEITGDINSLKLQHQLKKPYLIDTVLTVSDPLNDLTFSTHSEWESIIAPINAEQQINLRNGDITANGSLDAFVYQVTTAIDTQQAYNINLSSNGTANKQLISINEIKLNHEKTKLTAHGQIKLQDPLNLQLDIIGKDINPGLFFANYPGQLQVDTQLGFSQQGLHKQLNLNIRTLKGQLRGHTLEGSGQVNSNLDSIQLKNILLSMGDNQLKANGVIAEMIDIEASISAAQLEQVYDQAKGDLEGVITIKGSRDHPGIDAQLSSKNLSYQDLLSTRNSRLELQTDGSSAQAIDANINIEKIIIQDQTLLASKANISGILKKHAFTASTKSNYGEFAINAKGFFDQQKKHWLGTIEQLLLTNTQFGDWKNKDAIEISADTKQQSLQALCMQQQSQSICLDFINHNQDGKKINAQIDNFALANLQEYLTDYGQIQGLANVSANLTSTTENLWTGTIKLDAKQLALKPGDESGFNEEIKFNTTSLTARLDQQSNITLNLESNYGSAIADFNIDALSSIDNASIDQGSIQLNLPDLLFLNPYIKEAVIKKGQAKIALQMSGQVKAPKIKATGSLDSFDFYIPEFGTEYKDARLTIDANDISKINISGILNAEDKQLKAEGWIKLEDINNPDYQFSIVGDSFPVINTIDIQASVTPDLIIRGDTQNIMLDGTLHIPQLNIISKKLPDSIDSVSSDEIIINDDHQNEQKNQLTLQGIIDLTLGNNATFVGYGLQTDLQGGLKIILSKHQPVVGHGVLSMKNAHYSAVGQKLDISKGKIIFSGPIEDPSLDVQIQRTSQDVTVAMLITGKANDPQSKLISNPVLSEANKLSYLLTGKAIDNLNSGEGSNLTAAALSLGLSKSSPILQEIGTKFGFDTLSVNAGDDGLQSTSLLLGKHLSPKLYITYAKDLFSALGAIQMNYRLTDHISVEVESGTGQTVDLIYSISTD